MHSGWVHPDWVLKEARISGSLHPPPLRNLCDHCGGESEHDRNDWVQFPPTHTYFHTISHSLISAILGSFTPKCL